MLSEKHELSIVIINNLAKWNTTNFINVVLNTGKFMCTIVKMQYHNDVHNAVLLIFLILFS